MNKHINHDIIKQLHRRYATKKFDSSKKISDKDFEILLESLRLSPSSFGLQGWGFVVVKDEDMRKKLLPYSRDQAQVVDASHLIVLCRRTDVDTDFVNRYLRDIAETREIELSSLDGYKHMMLGFMEGQSEEDRELRLTKQTYIAQGFLLSSCAQMGIDACPMEGFDSAKYDEILELNKLQLKSCTVVPVGYRHQEDGYATFKKVRFPREEIIFVK